MKLRDGFCKVPLGLPLTLTAIGTVVALWTGKNAHAGFGMAWMALSVLHGCQHCGKLRHDMCGLKHGMQKKLNLGMGAKPTALQRFLSTLRVASVIPGRVRLYSDAFIGNEALGRQVSEYVKSFAGVEGVEINLLSGSLLIHYQPEKLRENPKLAELEQSLIAHKGQFLRENTAV